MADEFTAKFKVDIRDLKKGIQDANKEIKLANATFKNETAGMDKWSTNADGLSAKLKQLDKVLSAQKSILESYRAQLERQQKAYEENGKRAAELRAKLEELRQNGVTKNSEEYKRYEDALKSVMREQDSNAKSVDDLKLAVLNQETAVKQTEAQIGKYETALKEAETAAESTDSAVDDLGESTKDSGKDAETASDGYSVMKGALADLVSAGIQKAVQALKDMASAAYEAWEAYDEGADIITAKTGATGEAAEGLQQAYKNVSKSVVADLSDIGTAVGEVNTRFGLTGDKLESVSETFLKFAEVNGVDVNTAIDSTQSAMEAFGISASQTETFLDLLNKAGQDTGVSVTKLADDMKVNAPALLEMGYSASDAAGFIANLDKSGIDASSVMAGMKKALQNASKEGKPLSTAMSEIETSILNAKDSTEAITTASELFGNKAGASIAMAVRDGRLSFDQFDSTLKGFSGNIDETYESMQDAPDKVKLAMQNLQVETASMFDSILQESAPMLEDAITTFTEDILPKAVSAAEGLLDVFKWLKDNGDTVAAVVTGVATAVGTFVAIVQWGSIMSAATTALNTLKGGMIAFNAVLSANPIGIVIALIAGLVAAFVILWNKSEAFRNFWIQLFEKIKTVVSDAVTKIKAFFSGLWQSIKNIFSGVATWFKTKFEQARKAVENAFSSIVSWFTGIYNNIKNVFANVASWFSEKFNAARQAVQDAFSAVTGFFSGIWENIKGVFDSVSSWFSQKFTDAYNSVTNAFSGIVSFFSGLWEQIKNTFTDLGSNIAGAIGGAVKSGINGVIGTVENSVNSAIGLINGAIDLVNKVPGVNVGKVSTVSLPRLAGGGILKRGEVGILEGDGTEAVVPLDQNKKWIRAVAAEMVNATGASQPIVATSGSNRQTTQNFTQIINAPKAPSRIELYRQTKNLLALAKGV